MTQALPVLDPQTPPHHTQAQNSNVQSFTPETHVTLREKFLSWKEETFWSQPTLPQDDMVDIIFCTMSSTDIDMSIVSAFVGSSRLSN